MNYSLILDIREIENLTDKKLNNLKAKEGNLYVNCLLVTRKQYEEIAAFGGNSIRGFIESGGYYYDFASGACTVMTLRDLELEID